MSLSRCFLCFQPSLEIPQEFQAVLRGFIQVFNKFQPCSFDSSEVSSLCLCKSCWIHFMQVHKLDAQLSVKNEISETEIALLSLKIRRAQILSQNDTSRLVNCEDLDVQVLAEGNRNHYENDLEVDGLAQDAGSSIVGRRTCNKSETQPNDLSASADSTTSSESSNKELESDHETESEPQAVEENSDNAQRIAYENKWLPKNFTLPKSPTVVKQLSEVDFIYMGKYPFQGTETGFKCGLCATICKFYKRSPIWDNINSHIRKLHMDNRNIGAVKVRRKQIESDCESQEAEHSALVTSYENKWLPHSSTIPESSQVVKRLSEIDFMYKGKTLGVEDASKSLQSQRGDSAAVDASAYSSENSDDNDSETESLDSCGTDAASKSTKSSALDKDPKENESADNSGLFDLKTVKRKPSASAIAYENKWLPFNLTRLQHSPVVKRLSEVDFIYEDKYPFQGTETGFQCGLCNQICCFYKELPIWSNMIGHMKMWHRGNRRVRANKVPHKFTQIAPTRFQYGKFFVEKIDESYRCEICGVVKRAGNKNKGSNIMKHISSKHEHPQRTHVCEYCGMVFKTQYSLREHRLTMHETPSETFPCTDCDKTFVSRTKALHHQRRVHKGIYKGQKFICEICGKECGQKIALQNHVAFVHNGQKIKCKDCGKMFASQVALQTHRNSHTGKKYKCDICGMDFTQHYSVTRHKKTAHQQ